MFRFFGLLIIGLLPPVACARSRAPATAGRDDFGMEMPAAASPRRIASLNPTTTEILFALGAGMRIVGRTHWDRWPPAALRLPDLGNSIRPNVEAVLSSRPDLVILYASVDNRPAAQRLREAGIPTVGFRIDRIADFRRVTRLLGVLVGDTMAARAVVDSVDRTLARVRAATAAAPHPRVFLLAWDNPVIAIGGGSFMSELVTIAGGRNIYDSLNAPSPTVTLEDVARRDPDILLVAPAAADQLRSEEKWRVVRAVREGRVLAYDTDLVARPSVVMGEAAMSLARLLHMGSPR